MNADRWSRIRRLHAEALELGASKRRAFLERECGDDQALLAEIWELVQEDANDEFLEAPEVEQVAPGVVLGDFELLEELGSGGTGIVFRARQKSLEREVALKIMPRHFALNERRVARFVREAKAAAKLKHAGIAPIYEVGCEGDYHFFAMELVAGHDLARELELQAEGKGLCDSTDANAGFREAARIVMQTADALTFAHANGVVHRDVKPNNILLDADCRPRLVDFGLAKDDSLGSITVADKVEGTPYYMSPEQARLVEDKVDARTDIYSLGVVLYELLTRSRPFEGRTSQEVINKIIRRDPSPVRKVAPGVPRDLAVVCAKAMEKRPGDRYDSAKAMRDDLESFLAGEPIRARPPGIMRKSSRFIARHRVAASLVCAVVLTLGGASWARGIAERQSWPAVSITVADGSEARVTAIPINSLTGLRRGLSVDLGPTPVELVHLEPGAWRFQVEVDRERFANLDCALDAAGSSREAQDLELVAHPRVRKELPFEFVDFGASSFESRLFLEANLANPNAAWRKMHLSAFLLGIHEVTFGEYRTYLVESGRPAPDVWAKLPVEEVSDDLPVVMIAPDDARAFAEWYGCRLPYAPEWEFAAMGRDGRRLPWGDAEADSEGRANVHVLHTPTGDPLDFWNEFESYVEPAVSRPEGRTPEGLYNMFGNVAELTASSIGLSLPVDFEAPADSLVTMGGAWDIARWEPVLPAPALRSHSDDLASTRMGFRIAWDPSPTQ
jgi:serine/threonine protein kinase/formylglycine-generating enzyme required for sulfatase activity